MTHSLSGPPKCDHWARNPSFKKDEMRWYRFTGRAGQAMPEECVDKRKCQTFMSGWMEGKHPEVGLQSQAAAAGIRIKIYFFVSLINRILEMLISAPLGMPFCSLQLKFCKAFRKSHFIICLRKLL